MQPPRPTEQAATEGDQLLYTPEEAGTIVALTANWLVTHARKGLIPHRRIGKKRIYRFAKEDLEEIKRMYAHPGSSAGSRSRRTS